MDFPGRLEWALKRAGFKKAVHAARKARPPIPQSTMSSYVRGERTPKNDNLRALAAVLKVDAEWLDTGKGAPDLPPEHEDAIEDDDPRIVGYVGAGGEAIFEPADLGTIRLFVPGGNSVAVLIRGDSLGHRFDGWFAVYNNVQNPATRELTGKLCVVGTEDGRALIKWVYDAGDGQFMLVSGNGEIEARVTLTWGAEVLALQPKRYPR